MWACLEWGHDACSVACSRSEQFTLASTAGWSKTCPAHQRAWRTLPRRASIAPCSRAHIIFAVVFAHIGKSLRICAKCNRPRSGVRLPGNNLSLSSCLCACHSWRGSARPAGATRAAVRTVPSRTFVVVSTCPRRTFAVFRNATWNPCVVRGELMCVPPRAAARGSPPGVRGSALPFHVHVPSHWRNAAGATNLQLSNPLLRFSIDCVVFLKVIFKTWVSIGHNSLNACRTQAERNRRY